MLFDIPTWKHPHYPIQKADSFKSIYNLIYYLHHIKNPKDKIRTNILYRYKIKVKKTNLLILGTYDIKSCLLIHIHIT